MGFGWPGTGCRLAEQRDLHKASVPGEHFNVDSLVGRLSGGSAPTYAAFVSYSHAFDGKFAPTLQRALQRFAKPWYRMRALRVFRDETSLTANPGLWSSIQTALDSSEFFVLLASAEAARSQWVSREVEYWCDHKPTRNLLIALTDGTLRWDADAGDFDWERTTALPPALRGRFDEEPRYVDFSWARRDEHLSLSNPAFRGNVADLAARLHDRPKDDLVGEEVRQHRRTLRIVRITVLVLAALALAAVLSAIRATNFAGDARRERDRAESQLRLASARYLAARSDSEADMRYAHSLLLGLASLDVQDTSEGRGSLLANLQRNPQLDSFWRHPGPRGVLSVAFSPDGDGAASTGDNEPVTVWDPGSGRVRCSMYEAGPGEVASGGELAISSRGVLAATTGDYRILFADPGACRVLGVTPSRLGDDAEMLAFSADGGTLASAGFMGRVTLWDARTFRRKARIPLARGKDTVGALALSPDGRTLAAGLFEKRVVLLDYRTHQRVAPELAGHPGGVSALAFAPDGRVLVSGDDRGVLILWSMPTGRRIATLSAGSMVTDLSFADDGRTLAAAGVDGRITLWDLRRLRAPPQRLSGHEGTAEAVAFSPGGRTLLSGSQDGSLVKWDVGVRDRLMESSKVADHAITASAFRPKSATVALGSYGRTFLWDIAAERPAGRSLAGPREWVMSVAFSPSGDMVASGTELGSVAVWRVPSGEPVGRPRRVHKGMVTAVAFSPDGEVVASGGRDGKVIRMRLGSGAAEAVHRPLKEVGKGSDDIESVEFSPDGAWLAAVAHVNVRLWSAQDSNRRERTIDAKSGALYDVSFSPDSRTLAAAALKSVFLWDVSRHAPTGDDLLSRGVPVWTAQFARDGTVVGGREDGSLALWDRRGVSIGSMRADREHEVLSWAISSDGRKAVAGTSNGTVLTWDLDPRSWRRRTCEIVNRSLSEAEWRRLVGAEVPYEPRCR